MSKFGFFFREQRTIHKPTENLWIRIKEWAVPILITVVVNREVSWWSDPFTSELISTTGLTLSRLRNSSQHMFYQAVIFKYSCCDYLVKEKK